MEVGKGEGPKYELGLAEPLVAPMRCTESTQVAPKIILTKLTPFSFWGRTS
jgi:hypothetical protein